MGTRGHLKRGLAGLGNRNGLAAPGASLLIFHRIGGGTDDELDTPTGQFAEQLELLDVGGEVAHLDDALDRLESARGGRCVSLTFDDGFADVYSNAFPLLLERQMPFTIYLAAGFVGGRMAWEGSTADSQGAPALTWDQLGEMVESGLCTVGNHTWDHSRPEHTDADQLDRCSDEIEARLGVRPAHFAWTWGVEVPVLRPQIAERFRSAATGKLGRNPPGSDPLALRRIPVRASDPLSFFEAKLSGSLLPERAYAGIVAAAKVGKSLVRR